LEDFGGELVFAGGAVEKIKKRKRKNGEKELANMPSEHKFFIVFQN
jgi:hypothetical protein